MSKVKSNNETSDANLDNTHGDVGAAGDLHKKSLDDAVCKESVYRDWADQYDEDVDSIGYSAPEEVAKVVQNKIPHAKLVLDAGCGSGLVGEQIHNIYDDASVLMDGCDLSEDLMGIAREKNRGYRELKKVNLKETLPYETDTYDALVCCGVFLQGHCGVECLDEMLRVVRPKGSVVFTVRTSFYEDADNRWQEKLKLIEKLGHAVECSEIQYLEGVTAKLITIELNA